MACIIWSSLVLYLTCASWKIAPNLKQNQFGNVWTDTWEQPCIFENRTRSSFVYWNSSLISFHLRAAQLLAGTSLCHSKCFHRPQWTQFVITLSRGLHSGHSESKGSLWSGEMPWQPWYLISITLAVGFYPASLWTGIGTNQLKLMIGIFHMKGCSGVKSGNQAVPFSLDFP